ncbi:MAG: DUF305 domain-containing protein [Candidatus Pacebacteria bacterium]|nr:DUF305 domain-containing protein [Candidatus Paceibacterota bacterium]
MQNNNFFSGTIILILGVFIGFLVWGFGDNDSKVGLMGDIDKGTVTSQMHKGMQDMMIGIQNKSGDEFDRAFLSEMIIHHEGALVMANKALTTSKKPEILILASDIIAGQTSEIEKMKNWLEKWFGNSGTEEVMIKTN